MEHSLRDHQKSDDCGRVLPYVCLEKGVNKGALDKKAGKRYFVNENIFILILSYYEKRTF